MKDDIFSRISDNQLKQQVLVLLGYTPDTIQVDEASFAYCFANFFNIFKVDSDRTFNVSLKNSLDCIVGKKTYSDCINSLTGGSKKSFIIAPLATSPHVSFSVIYKSKDDSSFNCIVINKEDNQPRSYIQYTIPIGDKMQNIIDCLGYKSMQFITIDKFLSEFEDNSTKVLPLDFNCRLTNANSETNYTLEIEAAFNLAYSRAFLLKYFVNNNSINTKSNWDISVQKSNHLNIVGPFEPAAMHEKFLDNIKSKNPNLSYYVDELISIKHKNDKLYIEFPQDNNFNVSEFFFKLAFNYDETMDLRDCIKDIDVKNLALNLDFIYYLCKKHNLDEHISALDMLKPILNGKSADLSEFLDNLDTLDALFPAAVFQLCATHSNNYLVHALENCNCALNMINDMLNIAQTVNERLISIDISDNYSDDYYTPYDEELFEYPNVYHFQDNSIASDNKLDVSNDNLFVPQNNAKTAPYSDDPVENNSHSNDKSTVISDNTPSIKLDEEYLTPYEATTLDYTDKASSKHHAHSSWRDAKSYNSNYINFSDIYDIDNIPALDSNIDISDYLNPETFKQNVASMLLNTLEACFTAISMNPNNALCHYILGVSLLYFGKSETAQIEFKEACDLEPTNANFKVLQTVCLILNNKIDDATLLIKSTLELDPNNEDIKRLSNILSNCKNPDEIKDSILDLYKLNYIDISLELSTIIDPANSIDYDSLYSDNKFACIPINICDTASTISELSRSNLVRSYSSLDALNEYVSDILGGNLARSYSSLESIASFNSDILDNKLVRSNTTLDGLSQSNVNSLFKSKSISYAPNIKPNSSTKDIPSSLRKDSKDHNNNVKPRSFEV